MTVILILLVPAKPDVLSAVTQVAVVGIETVQGSVSGLLQEIRYKEKAKSENKRGLFLSLIKTDFKATKILK